MRIFVFLSTSIFAVSAHAADWEWSLTPYAWIIDSELDVGVEQPAGPPIETTDLLDKLDFAAQVHFEGKRDRLGFMLDFTNLQVSDRITQGPLELDTDTSLNLLEGALLVGLGDGATDLMFGFRALQVDIEIELETTGPGGFRQRASEDSSLTDVMIGIRHVAELTDAWSLAVRGDVASGDSEFTWHASIVAGYDWGPGTLLLGYKYMDVDFEDIGILEPEIVVSGPALGYTLRF